MAVFADDPTATIDQVASAAGMGRATVHRHFPSRDQLRQAVWLAALDHVGEAVRAVPTDDMAPLTALDRVLEAIVAESVAYRVLVRVGVEIDPEVDAAFDDLLGEVRRIIERAQDEELLDPAMEVEWVADAWTGLALVALENVTAGRLAVEDVAPLLRRTLWAGVGTAPARRIARR